MIAPQPLEVQSPSRLRKSGADATRLSMRELFPFRTIGPKERMEFCAQLAILLEARVPLLRSLEVLEGQSRHAGMRSLIGRLRREIARGSSLSSALALQGEVLDRIIVTTVEVGEESGRLSEILIRLADYLGKSLALRRKVMQALAYPSLVLSVAACAILFLLLIVVPSFAAMFAGFHLELPASTTLVLGLSHLAQEYGFAGLALSCLLVVFSHILWRRGDLLPYVARMPVLGRIKIHHDVARMCRTLGTMLHAQVPLVDALRVTRKVLQHSELATEITSILKDIQRGRTVVEPLARSAYFPPMVAQMIAVGEETSELDAMLLRIAEHYERELGAAVDMLATLLEPVLVLLLGSLVAGILISMYLPLFDMMTVIGGPGP